MKWTSVNDLREQFLTFFESKGCLRHKSYPLVPIGDKSILLINAGMTPLKKYFTAEEEPPRHRMATCQKCIRTPDIDRVGITARHGTFFEMLGNFSFGDYFKREAINWAWEFCTKTIEMPEDKLWVTVYEEDDEAFDIWNKEVGVPASRLVRLGKKDNFWEHGSGPCGPCSEIHFDRGEEFGCGSPDCKPGCDCDRYMEFWNLVFTQFDNDGKGNYSRLQKPNIDTGMGLERLACIMQGVNNLFEVDTVQNIMKAIIDKAGVTYGENQKSDISLRVITDHIRGSVFMVSDGVVPSNEGRGYVLRRLLRRAARHGRMLGIKGLFLADVAAVVARENLSEYPELTEKLDYIQKVIRIEEERFNQTIDQGSAMLADIIEKALADGKSAVSGEDAFRLYDTYGFPIDLTREIAEESKLTIDEEGFTALMQEQKKRARAARANISGWSDASKNLLADFKKTEFLGYTETEADATVIGIITDDMLVDTVTEGEFSLILDKTPFYGEGGGQVGDTGVITVNGTNFTVLDTKKADGVYIHLMAQGDAPVSVGNSVHAAIDGKRRDAIKRNHSVAHLLQAALRAVLGNHVEQAGSYVDADRVRFDFKHFADLTREELAAVEALVNEYILKGSTVETIETDPETAKSFGAMALFGEKYGKVVRVVRMGDDSCELCGGTHLDNTAKAGLFRITAESSVAAGVRRIEGITGLNVLKAMDADSETFRAAAQAMKLPSPDEIVKRSQQLMAELKEAHAEIARLEAVMAEAKLSTLVSAKKTVGKYSFLAAKVEGVSVDAVRSVLDNLRASDADSVAVIAIVNGDKLNFIASCGKNAVASGMKAGLLVKEVAMICGGGGGGRPDSAMAGGKDLSKIDAALARAEELVSH